MGGVSGGEGGGGRAHGGAAASTSQFEEKGGQRNSTPWGLTALSQVPLRLLGDVEAGVSGSDADEPLSGRRGGGGVRG